MKSSKKAYQYFLDNPGAKVSGVAKRHGLSLAYAYKLRDKARGGKVEPVVKTLESRAKAYGTFFDTARLAQALKRAMADHAQDLGTTFTDDQWEALEMIATKVSRIVNGDSSNVDSWHDVAGYATLVADRLRGVIR